MRTSVAAILLVTFCAVGIIDSRSERNSAANAAQAEPGSPAAAQAAATAPQEFKPVSTVHGLMHGQGLLFKEIQGAVTRGGAHAGEHIEAYAEALAELANVNTLNSEKEDYRNWAGQVRDLSMQLAQAATGKPEDAAKMKQLVGTLRNTCSACHDAYRDKR